MTVRPGRRSIAAAIAVMLAIVGGALAAVPGGALAAPGAPLAPAAHAPCSGSLLAHNYTGTAAIANSSLVPEVTLEYAYDVEIVGGYLGSGSNSTRCVAETGNVTVGPSGSFALSILYAPLRSCAPWGGQEYCNVTTGPYASVTVTPDLPDPTGYAPVVSQSGTTFRVEYYPDLVDLRLTPSTASATYSVGAVEPISAQALNAFGDPSPIAPQYTWTLSGTGWTLEGSPTGPTANVTASPGASAGELTVAARFASVTGWLVTPTVFLGLVGVPTTIADAQLNRTLVDVGDAVALSVNGSGAAGYAYAATVVPGLGLPSAAIACTSSAAGADTVAIACADSLEYPTAGVAQPVVSLTNGNSSADWALPDVTVGPPPAVAIDPAAPAGYAGTPLGVTVTAGAGTGTSPYSEACFASGDAPPACLDSPGPSWTFTPTYALPGTYAAVAWTIDAVGTNRSATTTVTIAAPLALSGVPTPANGSAGVAIPLSASVSGGLVPLRYWWNATGLSAPIGSGSLAADGPVSATFVPGTVGFVALSLVVVDALGHPVTWSTTVSIGPGLASAVVPLVLPSAQSVAAGSPLPIDWAAIDPAGTTVRTFASAAEIAIAATTGSGTAPGWVNASGLGPLSSPVAGWFNVPADAWIDGTLNVSVTSARAGAFEVELTVATGLATTPTPLPVVVRPDLDHLRLSDPRERIDEARAGSTEWTVTDVFGNPAVGGTVRISTAVGGATTTSIAPVLATPTGATEVWVNYTVPGTGAGTVTVTDPSGSLLLAPIQVPAVPGLGLALVSVVGGVAVGVGAVVVSRRRPARGPPRESGPEDEEELRRLAEGRAAVIEIVGRIGTADLGTIARAWAPAPAPADLADWIASLVTDGTLGALLADDGTARFCLAAERDGGPRVTVDAAALDRAERRRAELTEEGGDP